MAAALATPAVAQKNAQPQPVRDFEMESRHATSIPFRDMPTVDVAPPFPHREHEPLKRPMPPGMKASTAGPDRVAQYGPRPLGASPTVGVNFFGEGDPFTSIGGLAGDPSDSEGNVGLTQYVEYINSAFAVFDKKTGQPVAGPTALSTMFKSSTTLSGSDCATTDDGDPIVQYDKAANRWILSEFSVANLTSTHPASECIAVSTTSDATGAYNLYQFTYTNFNDYPKIGVWSDKWLVNYNTFTPDLSGYVGDEMCALDRANMLLGNPANQACVTTGQSEFSLLPSDLDGSTAPPASNHGFFIGLGSSAELDMFRVSSVNFSTGTLTVSGPTFVTVPNFTFPCPAVASTVCVPQPGTTQQLDTIGDRMMYRLAYRNTGSFETVVASHTVDAGAGTGKTGLRWYEIRNLSGTPSVFQSGTYAPDSNYRWVPSIAMDKSGNIAVGYSAGSAGLDASIYISTRAPGDQAGTLGNETLIQTGLGAQTPDPQCNNGSCDRWGDYTAMTVDPVDDCTMWYINQYMGSTGPFNWDTKIASFLMAGCGVSKLAITSAPSSAQAGVPFSITVKAENSSGQTVSGYRGTVHFTSSDGAAILPADYTFVAADAGVHTFGITLVSLNTQTITVADANNGIITPGQATVLVGPGPTAQLAVSATSPQTAGTQFSFSVTAEDKFGNTTPGYAGTVHFSSNDQQAVLPGDSALTNGTGSFNATLKTAGSKALIATDTSSNSITGSGTVTVIAAAASQFVFLVPATAKQGTAFSFRMTAEDPFGNVAPSYRGTVAFTSTDGSATKPANYTFVAGDNGIHIFSATLNTLGGQTLTATDAVNSIAKTSASITVSTSDPALHAVPRTIRIFRATPAVIVGSFTDDDTAETNANGTDLTATISWGDGGPADTNATIVHVGGLPNLFNVIGSHTYKTKGPFTVTVTVNDSAGGSVQINSTERFFPRTFSF